MLLAARSLPPALLFLLEVLALPCPKRLFSPSSVVFVSRYFPLGVPLPAFCTLAFELPLPGIGDFSLRLARRFVPGVFRITLLAEHLSPQPSFQGSSRRRAFCRFRVAMFTDFPPPLEGKAPCSERYPHFPPDSRLCASRHPFPISTPAFGCGTRTLSAHPYSQWDRHSRSETATPRHRGFYASHLSFYCALS